MILHNLSGFNVKIARVQMIAVNTKIGAINFYVG